jgi:hypothetical protein
MSRIVIVILIFHHLIHRDSVRKDILVKIAMWVFVGRVVTRSSAWFHINIGWVFTR